MTIVRRPLHSPVSEPRTPLAMPLSGHHRLRLLLFAAAISGDSALSPVAAQKVSRCTSTWETPRPLVGTEGRPAYVEAPSVLRTPQGLLLVGTPSLIWYREGAFVPPVPTTPTDTAAFVAALRRNVGLFGVRFRPKEVHTPLYPPVLTGAASHVVGAVTRDGTMHAVWLQEDVLKDHPRATLWYASLRGNVWSAPQALFSADQLYWRPGTGALLANGNTVHVVGSYYRADSGGGVVHARRVASQWRVRTKSIPALPNYTTAAPIGHDSVLIVFSAGDVHAGVRNGSHLFAIRTGPRDTVLGEPVRVQWSGLGSASWPALNVLGDWGARAGRLSLTWAVVGAGGSAADSLFGMTTSDGGRTWSTRISGALPPQVALLTVASDTRGNSHVAILANGDNERAAGRGLWYTKREPDRWQTLTRLNFGEVGSAPTLSRVGTDTLMLSWGRPIPATKGGGQVAPAGMYAMLVDRCGRVAQ